MGEAAESNGPRGAVSRRLDLRGGGWGEQQQLTDRQRVWEDVKKVQSSSQEVRPREVKAQAAHSRIGTSLARAGERTFVPPEAPPHLSSLLTRITLDFFCILAH